MPFGLTNAPASFQHLMNYNFRDMLDQFVVTYLDGILIFSKDADSHCQHITQVLERLRQTNLYAKAEKCKFHTKSVEFLGFIISPTGISLRGGVPFNSQAVKLMSPASGGLKVGPCHGGASTNWWPVVHFDCLVETSLRVHYSCKRNLLRTCDAVVKSNSLTKKDRLFVWTEEQEGAFQLLKAKLSESPVLCHYNPEAETILQANTSFFGWGFIISQINAKDSLEHPIAIESERFNGAQLKLYHHQKGIPSNHGSLHSVSAYVTSGQHNRAHGSSQPGILDGP